MSKLMTRETANRIVEEMDFMERCAEALSRFVAAGGEETAPFFTSSVAYQNERRLTEHALRIFPGRSVLTTPGSWEIAWRTAKPSLVRDPNWLSSAQKEQLYRDLSARIPVAAFKVLVGDREAPFDLLSADDAADLRRIGGQNTFREYANRGI